MADTSTAPHDTLTSQVPADAPLVRPLPKKVNGATATRYRVLNGPALSGVAGHSFAWIPRDASPGTYSIRLRVDHPNAAPDTLLLQVNVGS